MNQRITRPTHIFSILFLLAIAFIVVSGCNHYDELKSSGSDSSPSEKSHEAGNDCMSCHHNNNNGASSRWWYVAGTAYQANAVKEATEGEVQLWTGQAATGTKIYSMKIDQNGNFYTQKIIDFKGGYFPVVIYKNDTFPMLEKILGTDLNKSCNNCHGNNGNGINTPKITLN